MKRTKEGFDKTQLKVSDAEIIPMFKYNVISPAQKNHSSIMNSFARDLISEEHLKWFINEREQIRLGVETSDPILKHCKFCNILREHDKTTKFIFDRLSGFEGLELWKNLMWSRFINRVDTLDGIIPDDGSDKSYLLDAPFTNPYAYQLSSSLVKNRDYDTVREVIVHTIADKSLQCWEAAMSSEGLASRAQASNVAFGLGAKFVFYQIVLDYAQLTGDFNLESDDVMYGTGSVVISKLVDTSSLDYRPYEIENILCEYRKYLYQTQRLRDGKQLSGRYYKDRYAIKRGDDV